ncbi:MAG: SH3 domain-containing protein, partial [Bacteroidota bacterium]
GDLISDRHGYDSLLNWVANRLDIPRKRLFDAMIQHYREDGSSYIKEAVARFFAPESPLKIGEDRYYFSDLPSLASEIRRYFKDLDGVWNLNDLNKVQIAMIQCELANRLVAQSAPSEALALIKRVLSSMANQLDTNIRENQLGLGAVLHRAISTEAQYKARSHGYLLRLFYLFDKERGFRDMDSKAYQTLEEVGHYFAEHHEAYQNPVLELERAFYLNRIKRQDLASLGLGAFLGAVFADKAEVSVALNRVKLGADRSYSYQFSYEQSLGSYFESQGFAPLSADKAVETQLLSVPGRWFLLPPKAWMGFRAKMADQLGIPTDTWDKPAMIASRKKIQRSAWLQWVGLGLKEWASAVLWLLPWLGIAAMALLTDGEGRTLIEQWVEATGLGRYAWKPEADGDRITGLFLPAIWGLFAYLCMLIMRIWSGQELEVIGEIRQQTSRWLSLQGLEGLGFLVVTLLFPLMMWASNWLWEVLGIVLILGFGILLVMMPLEKNGTGLRVWRSVAGIICLLALARLGVEIYSWVEFGFGWKQTFNGKGWLDIAALGLMTLFFWGPPIFWQPLSAHDKGRFLSKALIVLAIIAAIFIPSGARSPFDLPAIPSISVGVPASNRLVPQTFYGLVNASAANVRSTPNKGGEVVGTIAKGVPFVVRRDGQAKYWWVITEGDVQGYMYYELIDLGEQIRTEDLAYKSYPASRESRP